MINRIEIKEGIYICFFEGDAFEFKDITLLVGDQGCGKSTLLGLIKEVFNDPDKDWISVDKKDSGIDKLILFNSENDGPRSGPANPNDGQDMLFRLQSHFSSHGETLLPIIKEVENLENTIILLDEPETALSLRSQFAIIEVFKTALKNNNQIIIATHNLEFMKAFPDNILSLEHMKYVTPEEFVELEKKPNDFKDKVDDKKIKLQNCRMGIECECTKESLFYDKNCIHYVDREGKSGYDRRGMGMSLKMQPGDFKNG